MRREINFRLLVFLLALLAASSVAALAVHRGQMRRHASVLKLKAEQAQAEGRLANTMRLLQRYLVFAPNDNDARANYGGIVEQLASSDHERWRAVEVYEHVLYQEPSRRDVRRRLARLALSLGWSSEARAHLEILIREQQDEAELYCWLGQCQEDTAEYSQAAASYEKAIRLDVGQIEAYIRLALLLQDRLDQSEKTKQVLDELVRHNDQAAEAYLARALHQLQLGRLSESERDLQKARELSGNDPRLLLALADLECRRGRWEEARRWLREGRAREPGNLALHLALATLERQRHQPREAIVSLREGLQALPDQPDLMLLLAETLLEVGEDSAVEQLIERVQRPGLPPGLAHYLLGCLQLHRQQWGQALRTLEEVEKSQDTSPDLASRACLLQGRCHERLGDLVRQLAALRKAVVRDNSSVMARMGLAATLQHSGRFDEALEQYREIVTMGQAPEESWVLLGRLLVQRNSALPARKQRWGEVEKVLERATCFPRLEVALAVLRAQMLLEQGRMKPARALLEQIVAAHPEAIEPYTALADLALRQGDPARSFDILKQASQRLNNRRELYEAEIALALRQPSSQAQETLRKLERKCDRLPAEEQQSLRGQLAAAYFRVGEAEEGWRLCRFLADQTPADLPSRLVLLDLAVQGGEDTLLARITADLRQLEGEEGTWWRYGEATLLLWKAQRQESRGPRDADSTIQARALVADVVRRRPDWSRGALLEASLHEMDREPTKAANAYLRAFRGGERFPGLSERLAALLVGQGRLDEADEVIHQVEQQGRLSPRLARLGADVALRQRRKERARELARLAVPNETRDYQQLIWLGQVLAEAGRPGEGEEALRQAVKLRDDLAETWLALIAHLVRIEQVREAEEMEEEMRRRLPAPQLPLALAIADELLARWDRAEEHYRQALTQTPDDAVILQRAANFYIRSNRVERAEALLRRLLTPQANGSSHGQGWGWRQLALLLAFAGDDGKYQEALALLPKTEQGKEEKILHARTRWLVQGTRASERRDALRRLEEPVKRQPFPAEELFCLVRLYEADGDEDAAHERMLDLLALEPKIPNYLAHHIERLLQRGRTEEARPWIKRLQQLEPESPRVRAFKQAAVSGQRSAKPTADR
jgi:tetratricopeptide (TPR) repeat protein